MTWSGPGVDRRAARRARAVPSSVRPVVAIMTGIDGYQQRVLRGAHHVLAEHGRPLLSHLDSPYARGAGSSLLVALLRRLPPSGVLVMNQLQEDDHRALLGLVAGLDVPSVHVGSAVPDTAAVWGENAVGMRELMSHLLDDRGARTIALIRGSDYQADAVVREQLFREEMERRGLVVEDELVVAGSFSAPTTYHGLRQVLRTRRDLDAVVALNDRMATAALAALTDVGLRVPEDVLLTGFDDDLLASQWPGLTTVDQNLQEQGQVAARLLLEQLDGMERRQVVVPSNLVIRGSTAPEGQPAITDLATAVDMARLERDQLAAQEGALAMSHALDHCWTVERTVAVLGEHLKRLGVTRCFLALYERSEETPDDQEMVTTRVSTDRARLVLDYRDEVLHTPPSEVFSAHRLVPDGLSEQLRTGHLILQPLAVLDRSIGYVLFEQAARPAELTELLRIHLSRAIDGVLVTEENQARAAMLERAVARRTEELEAQVLTRQRAERELQRANAELRRASMLDGLTQIANRAAFQEHLQQAWADAIEGEHLALLMVDVDAFKPFNDHYGHVRGDEALRVVASCLERAIRDGSDLACRYGGEEFAVVLPRSDVTNGLAVAERFQRLLAEADIPHDASPVAARLTVSIGVATTVVRLDGEPDGVIDAADRAMYRAKQLGRDQVVVDPDSCTHAAPVSADDPCPAGAG